ncbi:TetR family transcriptional regulator C-terminal domain-containing protein [bacterium]|nr:TetR family transcriptional regulator C-terminal domain-containing protein [bacterium]
MQRRLIASAAIDVINDVGLDGARLRDVAQAANVTTGAVMHYFDGKDAVLEAALEEAVRRILEKQDSPRGRTGPMDVRRFIKSACAYLPIDAGSRQEWRVWLAFWGRAIADERLRALHRQYYAEIVERLIGLLPAIRTTDLPPAPSQMRRCADALIAAIDGIGTRATLEPEHWPPDRQRETLETLLLPLLTAFANGSSDS